MSVTRINLSKSTLPVGNLPFYRELWFGTWHHKTSAAVADPLYPNHGFQHSIPHLIVQIHTPEYADSTH